VSIESSEDAIEAALLNLEPAFQGHRATKAFRELVAINHIIMSQIAGVEMFELDARRLEMCRKLREQMKALLLLRHLRHVAMVALIFVGLSSSWHNYSIDYFTKYYHIKLILSLISDG
jgi:hypothetical protein